MRPTMIHSAGGAGSPSRPELNHEVQATRANGVATQVRSESEPHLQTETSRLWLWFVAAFVLQLAAWTAWFVIAAQNKVQEVPLATAPARPR